VNFALLADWVRENRRWIAIGVALVMPWIWLIGLDRLLRRTR
jgi:hypothetical protein